MTFTGIIKCKHCGEALSKARGVLEREKSWSERQAIYNCRPNCKHVEDAVSYKSYGLYFDIEVHWEEDRAASGHP